MTIGNSAGTGSRELAHGLRGFAGRLRWHCHFMQKLEDEPAIEWRNFARTADGIRPGDGSDLCGIDRERLQAWCEGRTGFPMVDACMRQLVATGRLNFRMRAMLVSFAAYHLWLHWREPGLFLARQFLDFEPGIHWSQMQMQSGTTGINTLRDMVRLFQRRGVRVLICGANPLVLTKLSMSKVLELLGDKSQHPDLPTAIAAATQVVAPSTVDDTR